MEQTKAYVTLDAHGAYRIGGKRISLDSVVISYLNGASAETIQEEYPGLTLEEVYGAIAFYLANRKEVDQYLQRQEKLWQDLRAEQDKNPNPVLKRLRAIRAGSSSAKS